MRGYLILFICSVCSVLLVYLPWSLDNEVTFAVFESNWHLFLPI